MGVTQRRSLLSGLSILSGASLMLEVAVTRVCAAALGIEPAYLVASLALIGFGLGAVIATLLLRASEPAGVLGRLSMLSVGASATSVLGMIAFAYLTGAKGGLRIASGVDAGQGTLFWVAVCVAAMLPFMLAGAATGLAARSAARYASVFYFAQLGGAAIGCLAAVITVRAGAPRAVLIVGVVLSFAGLAFGLGARAEARERGGPPGHEIGVVATFLLGTAVVLAGDVGAPWLNLSIEVNGAPDKSELRRWSELGLVAVDRVAQGRAWIREDRDEVAPIVDDRAQPSIEPVDMAYTLHRDQGPVLVIDAGGGRDVRAALKAGQKQIVAVVMHPVVAELVQGSYRTTSGGVFDREGVTLLVGDGRSEVRRLPGRYRNIVLPSERGAVTAPIEPPRTGGLRVARSRLRTREAFVEYLDRLADEGTLTVGSSRAGFDRMLAVAATALRARAVSAPQEHLFACGDKDDAALLVKRAPFSSADVKNLHKYCKLQKLDDLFAPDDPKGAVHEQIAAADGAFVIDAAMAPPTDDAPFPREAAGGVVAMLDRFGDGSGSASERVTVSAGLAALAALAASLLASIVVSSRRAMSATARAGGGRLLLFFACIGATTAGLETAMARELSATLGHPVYGLTVVLPALLIALGLGSLLAGRVRGSASADTIAWRGLAGAMLLVALGVLFHFGGPPLDGQPWGVRLVGALALLAAVGVLIGCQAPLGLRIASMLDPRLVGLCWALFLVGRGAGSAFGALLVARLGYSVLLVVGAALVFAAAVLVPSARASDVDEGAPG